MSHPSADPPRRDPAGSRPEQPPADHLPAERLAALADGEPTPTESAHLAACERCRRERDVHARLVARARLERDRVAPPASDWVALSGALRAEGLLRPPAVEGALPVVADRPPIEVRAIADAPTLRRRRALPAWAGRAAAAVLLAVGGAAVGRASAGAPLLPPLAGEAGVEARIAALLADSAETPRSQEEAIAVLTRAERDYRMATQFLAEQTTTGAGADRPEVYQRRLAVMDEVAALTRAALYEAPHDPVLNQYYLASLSAREATLRQLGTVLPAGAQINRF